MAVLDRVRVFNKRALNPLMMPMAGRRHWYASVIEHTGRRFGKQYATPVAAEWVPDGFIVPLPHGVGVDWLRNVLAAGHATIRSDGQTYRVVAPQIISAETAGPQLRPERRRTYDLFGVRNFLFVKSETKQAVGAGPPAPPASRRPVDRRKHYATQHLRLRLSYSPGSEHATGDVIAPATAAS